MDENPYEPPKENESPARVGCAAKIGYGLLAVGTLLLLLTARGAWLQWDGMQEETRNRVIVLSVLGVGLGIGGIVLIALRRHRN